MNIDTSSSQKVTSKYFDKSGMDESLSDFQEKKKFAAPKLKQKPKNKPKTNSTKSLKKPKGQKDIRTVFKSKTSDLVAYSKDFGNVCKQSGIDVDPEQLQLAIALSRSVQASSETQTSQSSLRGRTARIRSTLQEYGFTVPEIKILNNNRKIKKHKSNYKLLLLSDLEKQRNINDKYSQILLQNICQPRSPTKTVEHSCESKLFYLTTNISYETIKDNNLFYVEHLPLEKLEHKGSLLRDWAEIPGRPVSPKICEETMDISEIMCSQEELNVVLSGVLKNAKNVINRMRTFNKSKYVDVEIINIDEKYNENTSDKENNKALSTEDATGTTRSFSPDMFDDDHSGFEDPEAYTSQHDKSKLQEDKLSNKSEILPSCLTSVLPIVSNQSLLSQKGNTTKRKSNDVMELTECVGMSLNPSCSYIRPDTTKRKSNDFMELTECLLPKDNIDLTQDSDKTVTVPDEKKIEDVENINLTQSSDSSDALPVVHVSGKNNDSLNDTVKLNDSELNVVNRLSGREEELIETIHVVDNNQSTISSHDLASEKMPKRSVNVDNSSNDSFLEDFLYNHSNSPKQNMTTNENSVVDVQFNDKNEIDLTQSPEYNNDSHSNSLNHNATTNEKTVCEFNVNNKTEIDLTQSQEYNNVTFEKSVLELENKNADLSNNSAVSENVAFNNIKETEIDLTQSPESDNDAYEKTVCEFNVNNKTEIDLTQSQEYKNVTFEKSVLELENKNAELSNNSAVSENVAFNNIKETEIDLTQSPESDNDAHEKSFFEIENNNSVLIQNSSISEVSVDYILADKIKNKSGLGKINNVSVDYDELSTSQAVSSINKTNVYDISAIIDNKDPENNSRSLSKSITTNSLHNPENFDTSQTSQDSEVFEISDRELDYSMHKSRFEDGFEVNYGDVSVLDSNSILNTHSKANEPNTSTSDSFLPEVNIETHKSPNKLINSAISPFRLNDFNDIVKTPNNFVNLNHETNECLGISPIKKIDKYDTVKTPSNNEYVVKTDQVTPIGDYNAMSTPVRNRELDKYGLKPLKRKRAIQLLTHIYNQTHPIVQPCTSEIEQSPTKKHKSASSELTSATKSPRKILETAKGSTAMYKKSMSPNKRKNNSVSPIKAVYVNHDISDNIYEVTNEKIEVKNIECAEDEWFFQKREKAKLQTCRVPLHIAFHSYVSCRGGLRAAMLRYEPVEIDLIHKGLVANGFRYDPKDLLKFLDKKCITVKTADNNPRNNKK